MGFCVFFLHFGGYSPLGNKKFFYARARARRARMRVTRVSQLRDFWAVWGAWVVDFWGEFQKVSVPPIRGKIQKIGFFGRSLITAGAFIVSRCLGCVWFFWGWGYGVYYLAGAYLQRLTE